LPKQAFFSTVRLAAEKRCSQWVHDLAIRQLSQSKDRDTNLRITESTIRGFGSMPASVTQRQIARTVLAERGIARLGELRCQLADNNSVQLAAARSSQRFVGSSIASD